MLMNDLRKWMRLVEAEQPEDEITISDSLHWKPAAREQEAFIDAIQTVHYENGAEGRRTVGRLVIYKKPDGTINISQIGVDPKVRGKGIATKMVDAMFDLTGQTTVEIFLGLTGDGSRFFENKFHLEYKDGKTFVSRNHE